MARATSRLYVLQCGEAKPASEFYRDSTKASGHRSICKECDRTRSKAYHRDHMPAVIARVLKRYHAK